MDLVRRHNRRRVRGRAAHSVFPNPSLRNSFEKLGKDHRGTRTRFTVESSLVELVWVPLADHSHFALDEC
jgi:hypothetical protein